MSTAGRSLELFFIDGRPDGMLTAEVFNWTGHVLRTPRTQIAEALRRREADYTGVYLLLGEQDDRPRLYIGEAEGLRSRLKEHVASKDWWDSAVMISTAGDALHKAHVKYLESRLVEIAREVGAAVLENGNTPTRSSLSEAARASMEGFLETLMMVLPAIRVDVFDSKRRAPRVVAETGAKAGNPEFEYALPSFGILATAALIDGELVVKSGSGVRLKWQESPSENKTRRSLHEHLVATGVIVQSGEQGVFSRDYAFRSPQLAACIVAGRHSHGRANWKHKPSGKTYAEWEADQLNEAAP